jgi:hypothetical protein
LISFVVGMRTLLSWTAEIHVVLERAQNRGEIDPRRDLDTLAFVVPAMIAYRFIVVGQPIDGAFISSIINEIVLPASGH